MEAIDSFVCRDKTRNTKRRVMMDTIDLGQESDGERELKPVFIGDVSVVTKGVYLLHNLQFEKKRQTIL